MSRGAPRRQARGQRRIAHILDVAAGLFDEVGVQAATTNAIAARAGISPGSLYQFFPNKDAIVEALAERCASQLRETQAAALSLVSAFLPLAELLDRVVDPLIAFELSQPAFLVLLGCGDASSRYSAQTDQLNQAIVASVEAMIAARAPSLPASERDLCARVSVAIFKGVLPLIVGASPSERPPIVAELKVALYRYLLPTVG